MKTPLIIVGAVALLAVGTSSAGAQSAASSAPVTIDNFAFAPAEVSVPAGTTLTWVNAQNVRHTATADNGAWDSGILANNQSFQFTLDQVGDFTYHCDIHPDMVGVVHVTAAAVEAPAAIEEPAPVAETAPPAVIDEPAAVEPAPAPTLAPAPTPAPAATTAPAPVPAATPAPAYYGY